jgi:hypothetical protein
MAREPGTHEQTDPIKFRIWLKHTLAVGSGFLAELGPGMTREGETQ